MAERNNECSGLCEIVGKKITAKEHIYIDNNIACQNSQWNAGCGVFYNIRWAFTKEQMAMLRDYFSTPRGKVHLKKLVSFLDGQTLKGKPDDVMVRAIKGRLRRAYCVCCGRRIRWRGVFHPREVEALPPIRTQRRE